jgi:hypothetical protein
LCGLWSSHARDFDKELQAKIKRAAMEVVALSAPRHDLRPGDLHLFDYPELRENDD